MELTPKLLAAADMCSAGEEVNLDELAFLLRYAADELGKRPQSGEQHEALLTAMRKRLLARCDLLDRPESERAEVRASSIERLVEIEEALDTELQRRFPAETLTDPPAQHAAHEKFTAGKYRSGFVDPT
ncbi:hypothetical protein KQI52_05420 [bacterium]|nr:hypothetical protein [bacterium]